MYSKYPNDQFAFAHGILLQAFGAYSPKVPRSATPDSATKWPFTSDFLRTTMLAQGADVAGVALAASRLWGGVALEFHTLL